MSIIQPGKLYKITNEGNGLVLDLSGSDHKSILGWEPHGGTNQQWILDRQDDGQWTVQSAYYDQKYIGFESAPKDGTPVVGVNRPRLWDIEILPDSEDHDSARIKLWVRGTLLVLEFPKERLGPGPLQLWAAREGRNQVWILEEYA